MLPEQAAAPKVTFVPSVSAHGGIDLAQIPAVIRLDHAAPGYPNLIAVLTDFAFRSRSNARRSSLKEAS